METMFDTLTGDEILNLSAKLHNWIGRALDAADASGRADLDTLVAELVEIETEVECAYEEGAYR